MNITDWFADYIDDPGYVVLTIVPTDSMAEPDDLSIIRQPGAAKKLKYRRNRVANPFDMTKAMIIQKAYFACSLRASFFNKPVIHRDRHLCNYKRPREISFDNVPRNITGKLQKQELRKKNKLI